jgi:hypothetical protein
MSTQTNTPKLMIAAVGLLLIFWGILGLQDNKNYTYSGYRTAGDYSVIEVKEGSPAAEAGFQVGDIIKRTGGISVTDQKSLSMRERPKIGEVREFVIVRNGEDLTLQLTFSALPDKDKSLNTAAFLIGLVFVLLGIFTYYKTGSVLSLSFALFAVTFGSTFLYGPYVPPGILSSLLSILFSALLMFSFVVLAVFLLKYPPRSPFLDDENSGKILYAPAILIVLIIGVLELLHPDSSAAINTSLNLLFGVIIIFYFGVSVVTLIQKYRNATPHGRDATGLNFMLWGTLIGLLPVLIYFIITTISPKTILPGSDYIFLTFTAIPVFFALALFKQQKAVQ